MRDLSVRLHGSFGELNITNEVSTLAYRSEGIGGFKSASFRLARPIHRDAPELAALNNVTVYDARSPRRIAWQGYLEDPGRSADSRGLVWTVNAVGPHARLKDHASPICYTDKRLNAWRRSEANPADGPNTMVSLHTDIGIPQGIYFPGWTLRYQNGSTYPVGEVGGIIYELLAQSGQHIGRVVVNYLAGNTDSNYRFKVGGSTFGGSGTYGIELDQDFNIVSEAFALVANTNWNSTNNLIWFQTTRNTSSATITADDVFLFLHKIIVQGTRYTKTGTELLAAADYANDYVLVSQVVADILGRWCPTFDRANAVIDTTTFQMTQLAYSDPVRPQQILDDMLELEPQYRYAVWGETAYGGNEFEFVKWDSGDVFEYDPGDGFSSPESVSDMYSDVQVRYDDGTGFVRTYTTTQTVPALQGLRRYGIVNLASERGVSEENVIQAASAFLSEHNNPADSGTLTVARPILNTTKGIMVPPYMIRPGTLLRLKGVQTRPDYLNAVDRNGLTMFRVVATEYSTSSNAATLELEGYNPTLARQLAAASQQMVRIRQFSSRFGG